MYSIFVTIESLVLSYVLPTPAHIQKEELAASSPSQDALQFELATHKFIWNVGECSSIGDTVQHRRRRAGATKCCRNIFNGIVQIIPKSSVPTCGYISVKTTDGFANVGNFLAAGVRTRSEGSNAPHYS